MSMKCFRETLMGERLGPRSLERGPELAGLYCLPFPFPLPLPLFPFSEA
jgi:hypothetical protein